MIEKPKPGGDTVEIDILLKLLPFFDIPLNEKGKESPEAKNLRRLIGLAKTEADMLQKKKGITTLIQMIGAFFDRLVTPGFTGAVITDLKPCFFNSNERTAAFVSVLTRIVWEYNFVNKMFVTQYKILSNVNKKTVSHLDFPQEVLIFGGTFALSVNQISALA